MTIDELENIFSNYLISDWSYSKVTAFARNEKAFEKSYIYGVYGKSSATTVAGQAYHVALDVYFTQLKDGNVIDLVELEQIAFKHIDEVPGNYWKLQKTTPTVDDCLKKAYATVSALLRNFISELSVYTDEMAEILFVELYGTEFLTINGVDIPLPCHFRTDLLFRSKDGRVIVVDHKSKSTYTSDEEIALSIGVQAITYVKGIEEKTGLSVDEVWFVENKYSQNKDKSPQLSAFKLKVDENTRRLYEALLYEPLKRMLEATSDPDYVYLINESDNFEDMAELYDFWARTMICEVEDFNVAESKKALVSQRLKKIRDASITTITPNVIKRFKESAASFISYDLSTTNMTPAEKIEHVLRSFGTIVKVAHMFDGYSSNTYLLEVSAGVKVSAIASHKLDLANALDVANVRIISNLVVHEGKSYLAVEFAKKRDRILHWDSSLRQGYKIPIGQDNFGNIIYWDLDNHSTPHALVCGSTGSGKSVCLLSTLAYAQDTDIDEIVILDPKYEFCDYHDGYKTFVYNEIEDIYEAMAKLVIEMQQLARDRRKKRFLVIFDEFADAVSQKVKINYDAPGIDPAVIVQMDQGLEENLRIILQKGRSIGFRVMAATQRASVKVITGDAKVNFPVQICFRVPKEADSRVVLDEPGAEALTGKGDGLIKSPDLMETTRFQAFYKEEAVKA
jgi:hypothetical protein